MINSRVTPSLCGVLAILFWGSNYAFTRSISEQLGPVTAAAGAYLIAGVTGTMTLMVTGDGFRRFKVLPINYLVICGSLFVINMSAMSLSAGWAANRQQMLEVSMVNYLWPGLVLVLSVPILKNKAKWTLVPGIFIAFLGVIIAVSAGKGVCWEVFRDNMMSNPFPYFLAFVAAVAWGLFSNLTRRLVGGVDVSIVPLFVLATGLVLLVARFFVEEEVNLTVRGFVELTYVAVFALLLAPVFWDYGMRKGDVILLASMSYFTPLLSVATSWIYLHVIPGAGLWVACGLVVGGALICKCSVATPSGVSGAVKSYS